MNSIRQIEVIYDNRPVGRMALTKDGLCAFEYSNEWLNSGFSTCVENVLMCIESYIAWKEMTIIKDHVSEKPRRGASKPLPKRASQSPTSGRGHGVFYNSLIIR